MNTIPNISKEYQGELVTRLLELAADVARRLDKKHRTHAAGNHIDAFQVRYGYANKCDGDADALVVLGDWNEISVEQKDATGKYHYVKVSKLPERVAHMLERYKVDVEWGDEWATCDSCEKVVRTEPTHWEWMPKYKVLEGELLCFPCLEEKAKEDAEEAEDDDGDEDSCALEHAEP